MADNYLERHYEEYEAKKAAWEKAKKSGKYRPKKAVKPAASTDKNNAPCDAQTNQ